MKSRNNNKPKQGFHSVICMSAITGVLLVGTLTGCKKFLEPQLQGSVALNQLITTQTGMLTAVNGMYQPLQSIYNGPMERLTDMASDDGWTWRNELETDLFIAEKNFAYTTSAWIDHYKGITRANTVIGNLNKITDFASADIKNKYEGQAKFLRAFYYFNLVRLFGGVPLVVNPIDAVTDASLPRATIAEVYKQINADLTDAETLLPASYSGAAGDEAGRPTTYAASALKALVAAEIADWDAAITVSAKVMGKGTLLTNYAANFNGTNENGSNSFFEVQYGGVAAGTTSGIPGFYAPTSTPGGSAIILPTDDNLNGKGGGPSSGNGLVQAFENGDNRRPVIIATYGLTNFISVSSPAGTLYYVNKYYNTTDPPGLSQWNYPLIRYAELLLTRAEALNEKGYVANGEAFSLLNQVRQKASLPALTSVMAPDQNALRTAIRNERRIELAFEGKRYFDLNRWGMMKAAIQPQLDYLSLTFPSQKTITHPLTGKNYFLYPIPGTEFINNPKLGSQNPGYNN